MPDIVSTPVPSIGIETGCGEYHDLTGEEYDNWQDCGCGQGVDCCGSRYCEGCHVSEEEEEYYDPDDRYGDILNYYSYTPDPLHFWSGDHGPTDEPPLGVAYYGMEIEVTCHDRDTMRWAKQAFNRKHGGDDLVYLKSDGSVQGFEAVTHPMTYPWALENFPWDVLPELKARGCTIRPSDNGIHVHVSRSGFDSDAHALRWFKLLYRNKEDVTRLARRESGQWARFTTTHQRGQFAHLKIQKQRLAGGGGSLYDLTYAAERRYNEEVRRLQREPQYSFRRDLSSYRYDDEQRRLSAEFDRRYTEMGAAYQAEVDGIRRRHVEDTTTDRYSAINTTNQATFEVRLFASTLDVATAQSTIGLVAATVEYARTLTSAKIIKEDGLKWPVFSAWLADQPLYAAVRHANEHTSGGRARSSI